tara:strand:+ start:317 stop:553 length:237 start_codon:yes stop_codon:yes gene_type:complete
MHPYYPFLSLFITFFNVTALGMEKAGENFGYIYSMKQLLILTTFLSSLIMTSVAKAEWILSDELIINGYITEPFIKII